MQENQSNDTQEITRLLSQFKPVPSEKFHERMTRAPWNRKVSKTRLVLQISAAALMILFLVYVIPSTFIFIAPPNTPTSTQFMLASPTQDKFTESTIDLDATLPPGATPRP